MVEHHSTLHYRVDKRVIFMFVSNVKHKLIQKKMLFRYCFCSLHYKMVKYHSIVHYRVDTWVIGHLMFIYKGNTHWWLNGPSDSVSVGYRVLYTLSNSVISFKGWEIDKLKCVFLVINHHIVDPHLTSVLLTPFNTPPPLEEIKKLNQRHREVSHVWLDTWYFTFNFTMCGPLVVSHSHKWQSLVQVKLEQFLLSATKSTDICSLILYTLSYGAVITKQLTIELIHVSMAISGGI